MRKTRRIQLVEIKARKTCRKIPRRIKNGEQTRRIITDYKQELSSANFGIIFLE